MVMNADNLKAWTTDLRTTTAGQAIGILGLFHGGEARYCCLGRGEVVRGAVAEGEPITFGEGDDAYTPRLATREFVEWLGVDLSEHDKEHREGPGICTSCEFDLVLDIPQEFITLIHLPRDVVTASSLNDEWHLSFPQIADMVDYFGIRGVIW